MLCNAPPDLPEKPICRCKHCLFRKADTVPWPEALQSEMTDKEGEKHKQNQHQQEQQQQNYQQQPEVEDDQRLSYGDEGPKSNVHSGNSTPQEQQAHPQQPTILLIVVNKPPEGYPSGPPRGPSNFYNQPPPPFYGYDRTRYNPHYPNCQLPPSGALLDDGRYRNFNNWYQYQNPRPSIPTNNANGQQQYGEAQGNNCRCLPSGKSSRKNCSCNNKATANRRVCGCEAVPMPEPEKKEEHIPKHKPASPSKHTPVRQPEIKQMGHYRCVSVPVCITQGKPACCECCECDDEAELEVVSSTCCCNNLDKCNCLQGRQRKPVCECTMTELERHLRHLLPNIDCKCYLEKPKKKRKKKKPQRKIFDRFANPPQVLPLKPHHLDRSCTVCCQPMGQSCYTQSYGMQGCRW